MRTEIIISSIVSILFMGCCGTRYVQNEKVEQIKPDRIEATFSSNQIVGKIDTVTLATVYEASTVTPKGDSVKVKVKMKKKPKEVNDSIAYGNPADSAEIYPWWYYPPNDSGLIDSVLIGVTPHGINDLDTNFTPLKPDTVIVKQVPAITYVAFAFGILGLVAIIVVVWKFGKIKIG